MESDLRLGDFWARLPAFRVIAETEHLPTASERLCVTAPALSRTLKLLEGEIGRPLFDRTGRRLALNPEGARLLRAVRAAMAQIEAAALDVRGARLVGPFALSTAGMFTPLVVRACALLREAQPALIPSIRHLWDIQVNDALLRGDIQIALLQHPAAHPDLRVTALAECTYGVYCGAGHPLFDAPAPPGDDALLPHPFAAPPPAVDGTPTDGWPVALDRTVGAEITQVETSVRLCASGAFLAVLPRPVVSDGPWAQHLRCLREDLVAPRRLHAVTLRLADAELSATAAFLAALRRALPSSHFRPMAA